MCKVAIFVFLFIYLCSAKAFIYQNYIWGCNKKIHKVFFNAKFKKLKVLVIIPSKNIKQTKVEVTNIDLAKYFNKKKGAELLDHIIDVKRNVLLCFFDNGILLEISLNGAVNNVVKRVDFFKMVSCIELHNKRDSKNLKLSNKLIKANKNNFYILQKAKFFSLSKAVEGESINWLVVNMKNEDAESRFCFLKFINNKIVISKICAGEIMAGPYVIDDNWHKDSKVVIFVRENKKIFFKKLSLLEAGSNESKELYIFNKKVILNYTFNIIKSCTVENIYNIQKVMPLDINGGNKIDSFLMLTPSSIYQVNNFEGECCNVIKMLDSSAAILKNTNLEQQFNESVILDAIPINIFGNDNNKININFLIVFSQKQRNVFYTIFYGKGVNKNVYTFKNQSKSFVRGIFLINVFEDLHDIRVLNIFNENEVKVLYELILEKAILSEKYNNLFTFNSAHVKVVNCKEKDMFFEKLRDENFIDQVFKDIIILWDRSNKQHVILSFYRGIFKIAVLKIDKKGI